MSRQISLSAITSVPQLRHLADDLRDEAERLDFYADCLQAPEVGDPNSVEIRTGLRCRAAELVNASNVLNRAVRLIL